MLLGLADALPETLSETLPVALSNSIISPIDWVIVAVYLIGCIIAGLWMKRYVTGVEDFAVAGREMDMNLGVASLAATEVGVVTVMYAAEGGFNGGFTGAIPGILTAIAMFAVGTSGFIIKPLRKAGVITIPELLEKQYGKRVRWLAGLVIVLGGVLNMGIFLRLGGEFLIHVTGYDMETVRQFDVMGFHFTALELTMIVLLAVVLLYTALGGMVSVLVTDYLQFLIMGAGIVIISVLVIWNTGWQNLIDSLIAGRMEENATKAFTPEVAGKLTNPFNPFAAGGIGITWIVWQAITAVAVVTTWQTTIARVLAAKDVPTAKSIYRRTAFYWVGRWALPSLWGACAFAYFFNEMGGLPEGMKAIHAMPAYLHEILPTGLMGIVLAAMLAAEMSTDSGYLLTWATVIYNDLIMPVKRVPFKPKTRLLIVRTLVVAIGIFLVFYGLCYELKGSAWDYLALTGNIYLSSMLTLLACGLYWKGANSWGAYIAIILGAASPIAFLIINRYNPDFISAEIAGLGAFVLAFSGMVIGSLLGNLTRRAYRGEG